MPSQIKSRFHYVILLHSLPLFYLFVPLILGFQFCRQLYHLLPFTFPEELVISYLLVQSSLKTYKTHISSSNLYCFIHCSLKSISLVTLILSHFLFSIFCSCFLCTFLIFLNFSIVNAKITILSESLEDFAP